MKMKDKLKFLQIDSSNEAYLFLKLHLNGEESHILIEEKRCHLKKLVPAIKDILESKNCKISDLDFIALNEGPGSWTGLRIAFSTVKILAQVNNIKVILYSNFDNIVKDSNDSSGVFLIKASNENYYYYVVFDNNPVGHGVISKNDLNNLYPDLKRYYSKEKDFNVNYELEESFSLERFADIKNMEPFYLAEGVIFNKFE